MGVERQNWLDQYEGSETPGEARHLGKTFGRAKAKKVYESWGDEDVYMPLRDEMRMLERAGFAVEVPWRRSPFAVIVGIKSPR
jgi:hypothetical protein